MANYYYDRDTDTYYKTSGDGFGWFAFFLILATPFFIIAVWLRQYALFVSDHSVLSSLAFLGFSVFLGTLLYRKKKVKHRLIGVIAVVISLLPIGLAQVLYAIPYILSHDSAVGVTFEWMVVTFFTVGIAFFTNQICTLFRNGLKHLLVATVYLIIVLFVIL